MSFLIWPDGATRAQGEEPSVPGGQLSSRDWVLTLQARVTSTPPGQASLLSSDWVGRVRRPDGQGRTTDFPQERLRAWARSGKRELGRGWGQQGKEDEENSSPGGRSGQEPERSTHQGDEEPALEPGGHGGRNHCSSLSLGFLLCDPAATHTYLFA